MIVATGSRDAADRFARGRDAPTFVTSREEFRGIRGLRRLVGKHEIDAIALYTTDWRLQRNPQVYNALLSGAGVNRLYLVDESLGREMRPMRRVSTFARAAMLPFSILGGLAAAGAEGIRHATRRRAVGARLASPQGSAVLAIWIGEPGSSVGGSVTHISGILGGFRQLGLRVGLVTFGDPPEQLRRVVDDIEQASPLQPRARLTSDIECLAMNRAVREAGARLARRLPPSFIYQRHRAFLEAGVDVAERAAAPLVLEWNASEVWTRQNWEVTSKVEQVFRPLLGSMERRVLERSSLVVAVSDPAAETARELGAAPDRVVAVPNGVDIAEVDALRDSVRPSVVAARRVGWIGSFGPWHGAEVLVRAIPWLPPDVKLLMIGDGGGRSDCQRLADETGVSERIEWAGSIPHDEALRLLMSCDVLASPHVPLADVEFFGSPTKLFEYMAIGRPIVASALGQMSDVLQDGVTARLVAPGDARALADGINDVLARDDKGEALGRAALETARRLHTWAARAEIIVDSLDHRLAATDRQ